MSSSSSLIKQTASNCIVPTIDIRKKPCSAGEDELPVLEELLDPPVHFAVYMQLIAGMFCQIPTIYTIRANSPCICCKVAAPSCCLATVVITDGACVLVVVQTGALEIGEAGAVEATVVMAARGYLLL